MESRGGDASNIEFIPPKQIAEIAEQYSVSVLCAMLCCAVPCRAVLCYAMLCYAMLCLIFPLSVFSQVFIFQSLILSHFESLIIII